MARPKKTEAESRRRTVKFLLTDQEMAALEAEASAAKLSVHEIARAKALGGDELRRAMQRAAEPEWVQPVMRALQGVGVNVNQIARRLNATGEYEPAMLRDVSEHLDELFRRLLSHIDYSEYT